MLASQAEQGLPFFLRPSRQGQPANLAYDIGHPFERREALLANGYPARARQQPLTDSTVSLISASQPRPVRASRTHPRAALPPRRWMSFPPPRNQNSTLLRALIREGMYATVIELSEVVL